jgi:hypothetical protein
MESVLMAGLNRAYKRRGNAVALNGAPTLCLDAGSKISYPGTGTAWTDLSGNANNGTLVNGPTFDSANGGSLVFDGVNDYASTPLSLGGYTAFTIAAWIKTTVVSKEIAATYGVNNIFDFWISASNKVVLYVYATGGAVSYRTSIASITTGSWVYCVGVYNGSTPAIDMYTNGALSNGALTGTIPASVATGASTVVIGNANTGTFYFNGSMGQVSIYNRALTAAEVATNFSLLRGRYGI